MSFWQRLFGNNTPRCPDGARAGELRGDKKHGAWIEAEGPFLVERVYRNDIVHGPVRRWRDGHLVTTCEYVDGKQQGLERRFDEAQRITLAYTYEQGELHGPWRAYRPDGSLEYEREYRAGKMFHGPYEIRGTTDNLIVRGRYDQGVQVGPWENYHYNGRVEERGTYVDGKRHGEFELGDATEEAWRGRFDMDERVGVWERTRYDGKLTARGEYPRGTLVPWEVSDKKAKITVEVATPESLARWLVFAERWLSSRDEDFTGWPREERIRARDWIAAKRPRKSKPRDESTAGEIADRDQLVRCAIGPLVLAERDVGGGGDYMESWYWQRELVAVAIANIELPSLVIPDSPEAIDARNAMKFRPGTYEVIGIDVPDSRLDLPAVVVRFPEATIKRWKYLGTAHDDNYILVPAGAELGRGLEHPGDREDAFGSPEWVVPGKTSDGETCLWITNPSGNGIRAFAGVDGHGVIVAIVLQLY